MRCACRVRRYRSRELRADAVAVAASAPGGCFASMHCAADVATKRALHHRPHPPSVAFLAPVTSAGRGLPMLLGSSLFQRRYNAGTRPMRGRSEFPPGGAQLGPPSQVRLRYMPGNHILGAISVWRSTGNRKIRASNRSRYKCKTYTPYTPPSLMHATPVSFAVDKVQCVDELSLFIFIVTSLSNICSSLTSAVDFLLATSFAFDLGYGFKRLERANSSRRRGLEQRHGR